MNKVNKDKMKMLNIKNFKFAKRFYKDLCLIAKDAKEKEDVFSDFVLLIYDCQLNEQSITEIIPDYKEFFNDTIKNINKKNKISSLFHRLKKLSVGIISFILITAIGLLSWFCSDAYWLSQKGLRFYENSDKYIYTAVKADIEDYEIYFRTINSFIDNKIIFDDGICKIYIGSVNSHQASDISGNFTDYYYSVGLVAVGKYTRDYGRIVCGMLPADYDSEDAPFVSYQIGGENFNVNLYYHTINNKNELFMSFYINGGQNGEKSKELHDMDKISLKFENFFVNEWLKK